MRLPRFTTATLAGSLALAGTPALADEPALKGDGRQPVHITLEPYLWAPTVNGSVGLGPLTIPLHVTPRDLVSGFRLGAMGRIVATKGRASLALEGIVVDFQHDRFAPLLGQNVSVRALALEMTAGYELHPLPGATITPLVGMRFNALRAHLGTAPADMRVRGEWLEPAIGATAAVRPVDRWELSGKVLAGYRDPRRHSLDLRAEAAYSVGRRTQVFAGYRHLDQTYRSAGADGFAIDLGGTGPLAGLRRRF